VSGTHRIRTQRILREAEGYLELNLPQNALGVLARIDEAGTFLGQKLYLTGEALRAQERCGEALGPLEQAADLLPSNVHVWLALGWCYKRTGSLERAIQSLEQAEEVDPKLALIHYNLACYWSLAGEKQRAMTYLTRAIKLDPHFRDLVCDESDFDPIRTDPEFRALTQIVV
jgi:Flp pilus assembly protein TadD